MDYLLDTHALIWFLNGDKQLSKKVISLIENPLNKKFVSIVSLWEISIKLGLKKLSFNGDTSEIVELIVKNNFEIIPISINNTINYEKLEFIHGDPFDRMLIIQAIFENYTIITFDENISRYGVKTIW